MSEEPREQPPEAGEPHGAAEEAAGAGSASAQEEELRRRLEQEIRSLRVEDVVLQSVVSIVNLTARRIGKEDERDLEQARLGIEATRALVDLLPGEARDQIRNALSELQMLYAREAGGGGDATGSEPGPQTPSEPSGGAGPPRSAPGGPSESKLWTPPGS